MTADSPSSESASHFSKVLCPFFMLSRRDSTLPEFAIQVGTPRRGSTHRISTMYAAKNAMNHNQSGINLFSFLLLLCRVGLEAHFPELYPDKNHRTYSEQQPTCHRIARRRNRDIQKGKNPGSFTKSDLRSGNVAETARRSGSRAGRAKTPLGTAGTRRFLRQALSDTNA